MHELDEQLKVDIGLVSQALNNTNATGKYYDMAEYRRAIAILSGGAMAATKTTALQIMEATDGDGTGAQAISGKLATITANTLVTECTVSLGSAAITDVVTINGIAFTMAAGTDATAREFADDDGLATCVNDETYGVSGVSATATGDVATLVADPKGDAVITVSKTENAGTITLATTKAQAYVELEAMDLTADFTHIACKVTTTANSNVAVVLLRGSARKPITQKVGASA